ncbi:MAG: hypothetical protein AMQ74_01616 [Candidatus Methanofastidiosum methylothiophilum]|uniref:HNH nuclease domain-containing protein n=1 Tax=Candidatus Methanofastidiosum methylothiophilum TaxID=1705564 RepID=A0A150ITM9_9EURY|nr:MAG: hypothetical protein AMQ74_01616 [Candidatus Methanofastidiosum methylthiophilus]
MDPKKYKKERSKYGTISMNKEFLQKDQKQMGIIKRVLLGFRYIGSSRKRVNGHRERVSHIQMEKELGRKLKKNEVVHHIDGNQFNDSKSNLLVLKRDKHTELERKIRVYLKENKKQPTKAWQLKELGGA